MGPILDGNLGGTTGEGKSLEAIQISDSALTEGSSIDYSVHVAGQGWQDYVQNGKMAGTMGQALPIEAVKIRLSGPISDTNDIYYRAHVTNLGWLDWAKNDDLAGTVGFSLPIEALEIKLINKHAPAPGSMKQAGITPETLKEIARVNYITDMDGQGWQPEGSNGEVSGSTGRNIALDGISIGGLEIDGGVRYRVSTWSNGWMDWKKDAQVAGILGRGHLIEGMQAELYGPAAYLFDIFYQVHNSDVGWMGWARNGEETGTSNGLKATQAIRVMILPKGEVPNDYDPNAVKVLEEEFERPPQAAGLNCIYVSIPRQQLIYYGANNEVLFKTPVITGQTNVSDTPTGVYSLLSKQREVDLVGNDYISHVHFWLPFLGSEYGIHDADSVRANEEFGGRTYLTKGSHGCVNLPYQAAAALNELVTENDAVIIR